MLNLFFVLVKNIFTPSDFSCSKEDLNDLLIFEIYNIFSNSVTHCSFSVLYRRDILFNNEFY